jgi:dihydroorotase-like cyclic amidohydrolase
MWDAGAVAFKTFTCALHGVIPMPPGNLRELFRTLATFDGITLIHAEDDSILKVNEQMLRDSGRKDPLTVAEWRWTPYDGMEVKGKIVRTILRGTTVAENGTPVGEPGYGQFVTRQGFRRNTAS